MSADARQVNITRSPIGIPCPVKVRPGTPDAEADESERTEFCAVNAQWLIGSQWCCDVHMLKVCDLLALDFCGIADQAGVPASVYDRPWADRPRADQGEVEKYQRWFVSREGFVCDFCGQRDADWDELCPGRGRRARHRPVADLRPESGLGVVKGARVPAGVKSRPKGTTSQAQRDKNRAQWCVVCMEPATDPAHLIAVGFSTIGQDDERATIPLCRQHHDEYDKGGLALLPYEDRFLPEIAYAVERFGLLTVLRRVTNQRDVGEQAA